ncbi:MAG: aminotransferase class I/II-fold pyridoxal phosphate-dependent enzyme [Bacilli bacterium]|nr:aminotransferase class I/II-fold pyridoxal phosphate-dependent enzyme [Bacilli bacterium]
MNKSQFDIAIDRYQSDSERYNVKKGFIPLTIADTDFITAKSVLDAIKNRAEHPLLGYPKLNEEWKKECADFYQRRFGLSLNIDKIGYASSVLAIIDAFLFRFTKPSDGVVVTGPVYNCFYSCIEHTGRKVVDVPIKDNRLDFLALEEAFKTNKAMVLCSPHNPLGIGFGKEDLDRLFLLAKEYGVIILSDEIHGLLSLDYAYTPSLSLPSAVSNVIMAVSPSKAFNTAGIHAAMFACLDQNLFDQIQEQLFYLDTGEPNVFAQPVLESAYREGDGYLDALLSYLKDNRAYLYEKLNRIPGLKMEKAPFTYLAWIDTRDICLDEKELLPYLEDAGVGLAPGSHYGKYGKGFLRLNFATPKAILMEAIKRIEIALARYKEEHR